MSLSPRGVAADPGARFALQELALPKTGHKGGSPGGDISFGFRGRDLTGSDPVKGRKIVG